MSDTRDLNTATLRGGAQHEPAIAAALPFAYGQNRRRGVSSTGPFEAILAGEARAITRFPSWPDWRSWGNVDRGDVVRFYDLRDWWKPNVVLRWIDVAIVDYQDVDLATCAPEDLEAWSRSEGWRPEYGRRLAGEHGIGRSFMFRPVGPAMCRGSDGTISSLSTPAVEAAERRMGVYGDARPDEAQVYAGEALATDAAT